MSEIANNDERFHKRHSFQGRSVVHGSSHKSQMKTLHTFLECNLVLFHTLFLIQSHKSVLSVGQCSISTRRILSRFKYLSKLSTSTVLARPAAQSLTLSLVLLPRTCSISAKVQTERTGGPDFSSADQDPNGRRCQPK